MLAKLEELPKGEANTILKAITEVLECGMNSHAHDAELMALKPQFDEVFADWWTREETRKFRPEEYSPRSDEEVERAADKQFEMIDKILGYRPLTRDGLRLQCRAMVMDAYNDGDDRTVRFITNLLLFFSIDIPDMLAVDLLTRGQDWSDEDEEEEEEDEEDEA
jgi:hypothetical protein